MNALNFAIVWWLLVIENLNQNNARPLESSMAEMAVQGLLEFWPCKIVNNPNFGLLIARPHCNFTFIFLRCLVLIPNFAALNH